MPSLLRERLHGLILFATSVIHLLGLLSSVFLIIVGCGIGSLILKSQSAHKPVFALIDLALVAAGLLLVKEKRDGFISTLSHLEYIVLRKDSNNMGHSASSGKSEREKLQSGESAASTNDANDHSMREMAKDVLEKAVDSVMGPSFMFAVGTPVALGICAVAAHSYGHDYISSLCTTLALLILIFGLGSYCLLRAFVSWQFDRILSLLDEELPTTSTPLVRNSR